MSTNDYAQQQTSQNHASRENAPREHASRANRSLRPSPFLMMTEAMRATLDIAALIPSAALLNSAPRGDGHPVMVIPGFMASDSSTYVLRRFLRSLGYEVHGWDSVATLARATACALNSSSASMKSPTCMTRKKSPSSARASAESTPASSLIRCPTWCAKSSCSARLSPEQTMPLDPSRCSFAGLRASKRTKTSRLKSAASFLKIRPCRQPPSIQNSTASHIGAAASTNSPQRN